MLEHMSATEDLAACTGAAAVLVCRRGRPRLRPGLQGRGRLRGLHRPLRHARSSRLRQSDQPPPACPLRRAVEAGGLAGCSNRERGGLAGQVRQAAAHDGQAPTRPEQHRGAARYSASSEYGRPSSFTF